MQVQESDVIKKRNGIDDFVEQSHDQSRSNDDQGLSSNQSKNETSKSLTHNGLKHTNASIGKFGIQNSSCNRWKNNSKDKENGSGKDLKTK